MLELYHHGSSACAAKVRITLDEKNIPWKGHYIDTLKGEQFHPDYAKLNPKCVVPTVVHDGQVIRESTVICEYLEEVFTDVRLFPSEPLRRAEVRIWSKAIDEELHPATRIVTFAASHRHNVLKKSKQELEDFINAVPDANRREAKRGAIMKGFEFAESRDALMIFDHHLSEMEKALCETTWLIGEDYSFADAAMTVYINRLDMLGMAGMWESVRPKLEDWWTRVRSRPSFQTALFDWLPEELADEMRSNGAKSWPQVKAILDTT